MWSTCMSTVKNMIIMVYSLALQLSRILLFWPCYWFSLITEHLENKAICLLLHIFYMPLTFFSQWKMNNFVIKFFSRRTSTRKKKCSGSKKEIFLLWHSMLCCKPWKRSSWYNHDFNAKLLVLIAWQGFYGF